MATKIIYSERLKPGFEKRLYKNFLLGLKDATLPGHLEQNLSK